MTSDSRTVTVFGGTGFLGQRIVRALLARQAHVRVATRHPERVAPLFGPDEVEAVEADVLDRYSVARALEGAVAAVNAVSLYVERGKATYEAVHFEAARALAREARERGLSRLVHLSGIGADAGAADPFIRSRGKGEAAVRQALASAAIVRPAVMIGPDDALLSAVADLVRRLPVYPLFGDGGTRLQPACVSDVGEAIARLLTAEEPPEPVYEFGGADILTYREIVEAVARQLGRRPYLLGVPWPVWDAMVRVAGLLPRPPLTRGQVALMRRGNVRDEALPGLTSLGVTPTPFLSVLREAVPGR